MPCGGGGVRVTASSCRWSGDGYRRRRRTGEPCARASCCLHGLGRVRIPIIVLQSTIITDRGSKTCSWITIIILYSHTWRRQRGRGHGSAAAAAVVAALTENIKELFICPSKVYGHTVITHMSNTRRGILGTYHTDARIHIPAAHKERTTGKLQVHKVGLSSPNGT